MKRSAAVIAVWMMAAGCMMTACGQSGSTSTTAAAAAADEGETNETEGAAEAEAVLETRIVKDSDGKEVTIPYQVTKVAPTIGAFAQVTEMLSPGKIAAASTAQISDYFKEIFGDYKETNPNDYDSGSVEDLIAAGVQVAYGPASAYSEEQIEQMEQAGIIYVNISQVSDSAEMMERYRLIGSILGQEEVKRAEEFCDYWQASIDDCQDRTRDLSDEERVKVLRLSVNGGAYSTVNRTDIFTSILSEAGGINVAADYNPAGSGDRPAGGRNSGLSIDAEQILAWDPDVIITLNQQGMDEILADPALAQVKAVKEGRVYNTPQGIYLWGVRSGENAMMTPWLGTILYPELFEDVDMEQVVIDFFKEWYHTDIDEAAAQEILEGK